MNELSVLITFAVGLAAALVFGYLALQLKLSPIIGYLLAGIAVGPFTPGVAVNRGIAEQFAEIGVILLLRMFNVDPFERPRFSTKLPLPFYFVWVPRAARSLRSAFGLTWRELMPEFAQLARAVKQNRSAAFILNGTPLTAPIEGKSWDMYGVIAAQRRASGSVWLVVSGLAGPATLAAAKLVKLIDAELPITEKQNSQADQAW